MSTPDKPKKPKKPQSCLTFGKALNLLHHRGSRLIKMHTHDGPEFFVVPGGRVHDGAVPKLLQQPDMVPFDDGLFPGNSQTWHIERN
jgi:hypothetical protein